MSNRIYGGIIEILNLLPFNHREDRMSNIYSIRNVQPKNGASCLIWMGSYWRDATYYRGHYNRFYDSYGDKIRQKVELWFYSPEAKALEPEPITREYFEEWAMKQGYRLERYSAPSPRPGRYKDRATERAWEAVQWATAVIEDKDDEGREAAIQPPEY